MIMFSFYKLGHIYLNFTEANTKTDVTEFDIIYCIIEGNKQQLNWWD